MKVVRRGLARVAAGGNDPPSSAYEADARANSATPP